jgi:hypothetical protein
VKSGIDRRQFGLGALAAGSMLAGSGLRPAKAAPVRVRVGWVVVPASAARGR